MSQVSGDAADRAFKLMIDGVEVLVRLTGSGAKNLATALYTYYKGEKKLKGAANLNKLLKSGKELRIFRLAENDLKDFKLQAKKYGILFSAIKDTKADDGFVDLFIKKEDISKVNHVLGRLDYSQLSHEQDPTQRNEEQSQENEAPKKDSPQRRNSNMQKSSSKPKEKADIEQVVKDFNDGKIEAMTPKNWKTYLDVNSQMYSYSQGNKQRIFEQNPTASVVMSKTKWRELGRYPKQGAKGILITMPEHENGKRTGNFINAKVYDISETYGRDISKSKYAVTLTDNSPEMKAEIDRLKTTAPVPVEVKKNLETDSFYNAEDKKIYLRSDITDSEVYKGLCRETQYANAHAKQGASYDRVQNHFLAESIAYSMAVKYGVDISDFRFDCIPDEINGLDGKDISELIDPATVVASKEIKKAEMNLDKFKSKERLSVKKDLKAHKQAVDNKSFETGTPQKTPNKPRRRER